MATKKTGISRDLLIHPGETIADVLEERGISQAELAASTGVSPAYVSNVIAGKKDISAKFALALEYALGVSKSFWINLQANYDVELLEANEELTITDEERIARDALKDVVKFLRQTGAMPEREPKDDSIISLRKALRMSNVSNVKNIIPTGAFRMSSATNIDPYVFGAWLRLCQMSSEKREVESVYNPEKTYELVRKIKAIMLQRDLDLHKELRMLFAEYGINFSIVRYFKGAPVHGYVAAKGDGSYQMVVTLRNSYADIFWFSVLHELGHIVNGDVNRRNSFVDDGRDKTIEDAADRFAQDMLIDEHDYQLFVDGKHFEIESINKFAESQSVKPYIVIGRLQKEGKIEYYRFSEHKVIYKWAEQLIERES